jgi:hypothetical protein
MAFETIETSRRKGEPVTLYLFLYGQDTGTLRTEFIDIHPITNAGTIFATGIANAVNLAVSPYEVVQLSMPSGLTYGGWSPWGVPSPADSANHTGASHSFAVARNGSASQVTLIGGGIYDGYEAARGAFNGAVLSGAPEYNFFIYDKPLSDNTGGISLQADIYTPTYFGYTDAEQEIVLDNITYAPIPIMRDPISASGTLDKSRLSLRMKRDVEFAELFRVYPPTQPVVLIILQGHLSDPDDPDEFLVCWTGRVLSVGREGDECVVSCEPISSSLRRPGLRRHYQLGCPHVLYGDQCRANKAAATTAGVVASISGTYVTLNPGWNGLFSASDFIEGTMEWTVESGIERRKILSISGNTLLLSGLIRDLLVGGGVSTVLGCNHQTSHCSGLHNNILNFGGCPWIPTKNPIGYPSNEYY